MTVKPDEEKLSISVRLTVNSALRQAIDQIYKRIDNCGYLTHTDTKQSDKNKEYFERVRREYLKAVEVLEGMIQ